MKIYWIPLTILLAGCAPSGVMPLGQDTYAISNRSTVMSANPAAVKSAALKEAQAYCIQQGKVAQIIDAEQEGGGYGKLPETDVQFRCAGKSK